MTYPEGAELIRDDQDNPVGIDLTCGNIANQPSQLPGIAEVTIDYTGDNPGGVAQWRVCVDDDPLGDGPSPCVPRRRCVGILSEGDICNPLSSIVESEDGTTPIRLVSSSSNQVVVRLYIGPQVNPHHNPSNPESPENFDGFNSMGGPFFMVTAYLDGGGEVSERFKAANTEVRLVEEGGRLLTSNSYECPPWRYEVEYHNAGPFVGGVPSDAGQIALITFVRCLGPDNETPGASGDPLGVPCCEGNGDPPEGADPAPAAYCPQPGPCVVPWAAEILQPVLPNKWTTGPVEPTALRISPLGLNPPDGFAPSKDPNNYVVYQVPLGECLVDLIETPFHQWDLSSVNGAGPATLYQSAASVKHPADSIVFFFGGSSIQPEVELGGDPRNSSDIETQVKAGSVSLLTTNSQCFSECCDCSPAINRTLPGQSGGAKSVVNGNQTIDCVVDYQGLFGLGAVPQSFPYSSTSYGSEMLPRFNTPDNRSCGTPLANVPTFRTGYSAGAVNAPGSISTFAASGFGDPGQVEFYGAYDPSDRWEWRCGPGLSVQPFARDGSCADAFGDGMNCWGNSAPDCSLYDKWADDPSLAIGDVTDYDWLSVGAHAVGIVNRGVAPDNWECCSGAYWCPTVNTGPIPTNVFTWRVPYQAGGIPQQPFDCDWVASDGTIQVNVAVPTIGSSVSGVSYGEPTTSEPGTEFTGSVAIWSCYYCTAQNLRRLDGLVVNPAFAWWPGPWTLSQYGEWRRNG